MSDAVWENLKILTMLLTGPVIVVTVVIILLLLALENAGCGYNG